MSDGELFMSKPSPTFANPKSRIQIHSDDKKPSRGSHFRFLVSAVILEAEVSTMQRPLNFFSRMGTFPSQSPMNSITFDLC